MGSDYTDYIMAEKCNLCSCNLGGISSHPHEFFHLTELIIILISTGVMCKRFILGKVLGYH